MNEPQPSNPPEGGNLSEAPRPIKRQENMLLNLGFNLLIPIVLLNKGERWFGGFLESFTGNPTLAVLLIAVAFPVTYFIYDFVRRRRYNLFSILGFISVVLTGGIGLFELPTAWFAVKEAAIPFILGLAVVLSLKTPYPLIRTFLYNPEFIAVPKIDAALEERGTRGRFDRLLLTCTWLVAGSFFLSTTLNYFLARMIVTSPSGTEAYNTEVGRFMVWSWPVIVIPCMLFMIVAMILLFKGLTRLTGLTLDEMMVAQEKEKPAKARP